MHAGFWFALFLLGCYHGVNPAMGWLFAVALALQERNRRAIFVALPPIVLGHLFSVLGIVALAAVAKETLPQPYLKYGASIILIAFGLYRFISARHFRWVGMRVGFWGLAAWAFLMATGHGAGLMLLPLLLPFHATNLHPMSMPGMTPQASAVPFGVWLLAVAVHTAGYVLAMTVSAIIVYDRLGIAILRTAWVNFDVIWAVALVLSGLILLFL
jgi:hypothetical protein